MCIEVPAERTTVRRVEYIEVSVPTDMSSLDGLFALEPHVDAPNVQHVKSSRIWPPPGINLSVPGKIRIRNLTNAPRVLKKYEQFC